MIYLSIYLSMLETEDEQNTMSSLYEAFKHDAFYIALKVTGNESMAEDAVHEAFASIIKHKEKYFSLSRSDFRRKFVIVVKNKCIDILRKNNRISNTPFEDIEYELDSDDDPVDTQVIRMEDYAMMRECLKNLDEISRAVLQMKYIQEMSYKEIGESLGMTPKHVETRIARAKEKVRKQISLREGVPYGKQRKDE